MYVYIYIYIYTYVYVYIYIYNTYVYMAACQRAERSFLPRPRGGAVGFRRSGGAPVIT